MTETHFLGDEVKTHAIQDIGRCSEIRITEYNTSPVALSRTKMSFLILILSTHRGLASEEPNVKMA